MRLTGFELIKLLKKDGWIEHGQATHGIILIKRVKKRTRVTIVPKSRATLPKGTYWRFWGKNRQVTRLFFDDISFSQNE